MSEKPLIFAEVEPSPFAGGWCGALKKMIDDPTTPPELRRAALDQTEAILRPAVEEAWKRKSDLGRLISRMNLIVEASEELDKWSAADLRLERADKARLPSLLAAVASGSANWMNPEWFEERDKPENYEMIKAISDFIGEFSAPTNSFVVQHDWAKAFAGATDFDAGEFKLPYERTIFEFEISGRRVIAMCKQDEHFAIHFFASGRLGWTSSCGLYWHGHTGDPNRETLLSAFQFIYAQVRAICIALDANIAVSEVVREERTGSAATKDPLPKIGYRVVSLARRSRAMALPVPLGTHRSPRLHFRRGHWRKYPAHRVWVRWTLVGNPDLGFVEKEYRL